MAEFVAGQPVHVDESLPDSMKQLIQSITQPVKQPFARELWIYDSIPRLEKISVRSLIVIGKKDIQADWQVDGPLFEAVAKDHPNIQIAYMETANHVLKYEPKPRSELTPAHAMATYSAEGLDLDPETVETIVSWLRDQIS
jgi:hypothetical protein